MVSGDGPDSLFGDALDWLFSSLRAVCLRYAQHDLSFIVLVTCCIMERSLPPVLMLAPRNGVTFPTKVWYTCDRVCDFVSCGKPRFNVFARRKVVAVANIVTIMG